jgi:paraquat-inducible protein B
VSSNRRYALIGLFVLGALLITMIGIALITGVGLGSAKVKAVMVFRGNVTGLEIGTPVQFRGMKIGEVRRVRTIYDPDSKHVLFPVYAEFTGTIEIPGYDARKSSDSMRRAWLNEMVERGLRAQLQTKSFVTGQQMIMLDFQPEVAAEFAKMNDGLLEIPTALSPNEAMFDALKELPVRAVVFEGQKLITQLNGLLGETNGKPGALLSLLQNLNDASSALKTAVPTLSEQTNLSLRELQRTLEQSRGAIDALGRAGQSLDRQVVRAANSVTTTMSDVSALSQQLTQSTGRAEQALDQTVSRLGNRVTDTLDKLDRSMARIEHSLSEDAPLAAGLTGSLAEVRAAAQALRQTADELNRKPDLLLFGHRPQN